MTRPEILSRIRETCEAGLKRWYQADAEEIANPWYNDHPAVREMVENEMSAIKSQLGNTPAGR